MKNLFFIFLVSSLRDYCINFVNTFDKFKNLFSEYQIDLSSTELTDSELKTLIFSKEVLYEFYSLRQLDCLLIFNYTDLKEKLENLKIDLEISDKNMRAKFKVPTLTDIAQRKLSI